MFVTQPVYSASVAAGCVLLAMLHFIVFISFSSRFCCLNWYQCLLVFKLFLNIKPVSINSEVWNVFYAIFYSHCCQCVLVHSLRGVTNSCYLVGVMFTWPCLRISGATCYSFGGYATRHVNAPTFPLCQKLSAMDY